MLGLFGSLNLGNRALMAQREGVEVTGHNLANINQPGYTRQRLNLQSSTPLAGSNGQQGTGVQTVGILQVRDQMVERQILSETSVGGSLETQLTALRQAQSMLGQQIDRQTDATGATGATGLAGSNSLLNDLDSFFNSLQSLATQPTSLDARQSVLTQAQNTAQRFNQIDQRLTELNTSLNESLKTDVTAANGLLSDIAKLNEQIANIEVDNPGSANDLRDIRQQKLGDLAQIVKFDATEDSTGSVEITIAGVSMVSGKNRVDQLEAYDTGAGQFAVRSQSAGNALTVTGGRLHGIMEARDTHLGDLRARIDSLASNFASEINAVHASGYNLSGGSGNAFFTGTTAATIAVNSVLVNDPNLLQASGVAGERSNNRVALSLAQLGQQNIAALGNQTFSQQFGQTVTSAGEAINSLDNQLSDQKLVQDALQRQRDSVSGVSIDEEMTNMVKYQKAFEASAKFINTVDEMLDTVIGLKR